MLNDDWTFFICIGNLSWLAPHDIGKCFKIHFYEISELFIMTFEWCVSPQIIWFCTGLKTLDDRNYRTNTNLKIPKKSETVNRRRTDNTMTKGRTDNTMAKGRTDNTITKGRTDNAMAKGRTDNTITKGGTDNTMAKGKRERGHTLV